MDRHKTTFTPRVVSPDGGSRHTEAEIIDSVIAALRNIAYGAVTITVHGSKVVQIDVTERQRFGA